MIIIELPGEDFPFEGHTWTEVVEDLRRRSEIDKDTDDSTDAVLDRFVDRWEKIHLREGQKLTLPSPFDLKAEAFFRTLLIRGHIKMREE